MRSSSAEQALLPPLLALIAGSLVAGAAIGSDTRRPDKRDSGVSLLSSDPASTRLLIEAGTPTFEAVKEEEGKSGLSSVRVVLDGFTSMSPPGAPDVPGRTVLVAIPAGAQVKFDVETAEESTFSGIHVAPVPTPGPRPEDGTPPTWELREDPAFASAPYPSDRVTVSSVERIRDLEVVGVTVRPVIADRASGTVRVAGKMIVTLHTTGGKTRDLGRAEPPAASPGAFALAQVVNPEAAKSFVADRARSAAPPAFGGGASFESSPNWVKVYVASRGLVGLDGARLASAGVAITGIDPATLRLFWGGGLDPEGGVSPRSPAAPPFMTECAIRVVDGGDGRLDSGDSILFLGQGASGWLDDYRGGAYTVEFQENPKVDRGVYWLTWGGVFPGAPLRMTSRDASPTGAPVADRGLARIHRERNQRYLADLYERGQKWERWWWLQLRAEDPRVSFPVTAVRPDITVPATLRLRLWGFTAAGAVFDHYARVWFNSRPILDPADGDSVFAWDGPSAPQPPLETSGRKDIVDSNLTLIDGDNRVDVDVLPGQIDQVMVAWFDLSYVRRLDLTGEPGGEIVPTGVVGPATVEVTGAPAGATIFDVTDPRSPVELTGLEVQGATTRFAAELGASAPQKFLVGVTPVAPAAVEVDRSQPHLRNPAHSAWYVVIAHDSMIDEAVRLAEAHARVPPPEGAPPGTPLAVRISDVYDEFGWGLKSEIAIRNFIDYAVHAWADGPTYVCLLGDASYDAKDVFGNGRRETDLVPAPQKWNWIGGQYLGSDYLDDDFYTQTFGDSLETPPDPLTDLAIGRLPASDPDEARVMVDGKAIPYLTSPEYGTWRQRALLAADDERAGGASGEYYHTANSERISSLLPDELERVKLYMIEYPRDPGGAKPAARAAFIQAFDAGAVFVNFIGHGAPDVLAHEALFRVENVGQLLNGARLPFFSTFSCTVNRFDQPSAEGIGEALVGHSTGGSIASLGSTDLAFVTANQILNEGTYSGFFVGGDFTRPRTFGIAAAQSKNALAPSDSSGARKYVFLGDPALAPSTPKLRVPIRFPGAAGTDTTQLVAGIRYDLTAAPEGGAPSAWNGQIVARDSENLTDVPQAFPPFTYAKAASPFFRSALDVSGDTLSTALVVPVDASQSLTPGRGLGEVRLYAVAGNWDGLGVQPAFLDVVHASPGEPEPVDSPRIEATFAGDSRAVPPDASLLIRIEDKSGINIVGNTPANFVFMRIDETRTVVLNDLFAYDPGSATRGSVTYRLPGLAEGPHLARIFASDNYLNRGEAEVPFSVVVSGGFAIAAAGLYPNPLAPGDLGTIFSFEVPEPAEVSLRIYSVSGKLVRSRFPGLGADVGAGVQQIHWDGRDEDGDLIANGVYLCSISARGLLSRESATTVVRALVNR